MFNLPKGIRDAIFPALVFALMALGVLVTSSKAEVMNPNGVPMTKSDWAEKSPDAAAVTVQDALGNSDNSTVIAAIPKNSPNTLDLVGSDSAGSIWWPGNPNAEIKLNIISGSGSQIGSCTVSSAKDKAGKYVTKC